MSLYLKQRVFSWGDKFSVYDENGAVKYTVEGEIFTFGKYKGRSVEEVFRAEPSYYTWMMEGSFPQYTKKIITEIRLRIK